MSLVQVGLDLLFDKRCLIMGFSTKPVAIAALQSTFLCRSADPSLGVLKDGLYDLFWLVKSRDFTRGGRLQLARRREPVTRVMLVTSTHNAKAERERDILRRSLLLSLSRGIFKSRPARLI